MEKVGCVGGGLRNHFGEGGKVPKKAVQVCGEGRRSDGVGRSRIAPPSRFVLLNIRVGRCITVEPSTLEVLLPELVMKGI